MMRSVIVFLLWIFVLKMAGGSPPVGEDLGGAFFAAADCTGHGVPGAMVSVVCYNALNRAVREFGNTEPSKILDKTRDLVIETFEKSEEEVKDGMDISLCRLTLSAAGGALLQWAGANNPLWIINPNRTEWPENSLPFGEGRGGALSPHPLAPHHARSNNMISAPPFA